MTDAIIICLIAAVVVLIAIGLIDYEIRKLGKNIVSYFSAFVEDYSHRSNRVEKSISDMDELLNYRLYKDLTTLTNNDDKLIEAMKILTEVTKENADRIDCLHEYLNMFDDTVITTIRDNYSYTREIKDILNKIDVQTVGASLEYTDESFRKMLEANGKGE